jgi:hypothetical protein
MSQICPKFSAMERGNLVALVKFQVEGYKNACPTVQDLWLFKAGYASGLGFSRYT